jgi:outer membrane protein assembly factor BamB
MSASKVRAHKLRDARTPKEPPPPGSPAGSLAGEKRDYHWAQTHEPWASQLIAFTSLLFNPRNGLIYCGLTSLNNDLLYTFDPNTAKFESLGYSKIVGTDRYDVKIHRSLVQDDDGTIYGATACLHPHELRLEGKGGKLFSLDPNARRIELLGVPVPYDYIQTIALDRKRKVLYCNTYPVWQMAMFDLKTRQSKHLGIGSLGHRAFCDQDGNVWGSYDDSRKLFKYNPDDGFTKFDATLPKLNRNPVNWGMAIPAPDERAIYMGTAGGGLWRLDPDTAEARYLGKPLADDRIEGLVFGRDGLLFGAGGWNETGLFACDRESKKLYDLGPIFDPEINERCVIPHDICMTDDGTIYTGETDNTERSCYLWECRVEM